MLTKILLAAALIAGFAMPGLAADAVAARFGQTFRRVDRRCTNWQFCTDRELPQLWQLAGKFLASQLASRPDVTTDDLVAALKRLDRELPRRERHAPAIDASATRLPDGDFVITIQYFETGTVFIIGPARVKWSIASALRCWEASCGPYYGSITLLPSAANSNPRFLIEAWHAGEGVTVGAQTSAWRWDGRQAHLLAIDEHPQMIDDGRQTKIDHDLVIVPTREIAHMFSSIGASAEPAGTWTLRLTANGAKSLGHQWVHRELRWADNFFFALDEGRPVDQFCTAEVAREMRWPEVGLGGMVMEVHVDGQTLHLVTDNGSFTFMFDPRHAGLYAVAVRFD